MRDTQPPEFGDSLSVAVFAKGCEVILTDDDDATTSGYINRGFIVCGHIALENGVPRVRCQPGFYEAAAMVRAGQAFAEFLGPRIQAWQLALADVNSKN